MQCTIGNAHFTFSDVPLNELSKFVSEITASTNRADNVEYESEEYHEERNDEENEEDDEENEERNDEENEERNDEENEENEENEEINDEENEENDEENEQHNEDQLILPIYQPVIPEVANIDGVIKFKCIHHGCLKTCKTLGEIQGHWVRMHMHERWQDLCHPVYVNDCNQLPSRRKWVCLRERCTCVKKGGFNKQRMACHLALYYQNSLFYDGR
jgi:hypothetical protein